MSTPIIECPKCQHTMSQIQIESGILVDRCANCGGLFLDLFEKEFLAKAKDRANELDLESNRDTERLDRIRAIDCPRDKSRMIHIQALENSEIGIETCTICGAVFLDSGELRELTKKSLVDRIRQAFS